jgi:hypothetical protein
VRRTIYFFSMVTLLGSHPVSLLGPIEGTLIFKIDRALARIFHKKAPTSSKPLIEWRV